MPSLLLAGDDELCRPCFADAVRVPPGRVPPMMTFRGRDPPRVERGVYSRHEDFEGRRSGRGIVAEGVEPSSMRSPI